MKDRCDKLRQGSGEQVVPSMTDRQAFSHPFIRNVIPPSVRRTGMDVGGRKAWRESTRQFRPTDMGRSGQAWLEPVTWMRRRVAPALNAASLRPRLDSHYDRSCIKGPTCARAIASTSPYFSCICFFFVRIEAVRCLNLPDGFPKHWVNELRKGESRITSWKMARAGRRRRSALLALRRFAASLQGQEIDS